MLPVKDRKPQQNTFASIQKNRDRRPAGMQPAEPPLDSLYFLQRHLGNSYLQAAHQLKEASPGDEVDFTEQQTGRENKTGLPDQLKAGIENLSGLAMDDVRVHYNSSKPAELQALAYTQGTEIHLGPGQERYLPHEAWHVVQQKKGRVRAMVQMKDGVPVNDDVGLEREAGVMGESANATQPSVPAGSQESGGRCSGHRNGELGAPRVAQLYRQTQKASEPSSSSWRQVRTWSDKSGKWIEWETDPTVSLGPAEDTDKYDADESEAESGSSAVYRSRPVVPNYTEWAKEKVQKLFDQVPELHMARLDAMTDIIKASDKKQLRLREVKELKDIEDIVRSNLENQLRKQNTRKALLEKYLAFKTINLGTNLVKEWEKEDMAEQRKKLIDSMVRDVVSTLDIKYSSGIKTEDLKINPYWLPGIFEVPAGANKGDFLTLIEDFWLEKDIHYWDHLDKELAKVDLDAFTWEQLRNTFDPKSLRFSSPVKREDSTAYDDFMEKRKEMPDRPKEITPEGSILLEEIKRIQEICYYKRDSIGRILEIRQEIERCKLPSNKPPTTMEIFEDDFRAKLKHDKAEQDHSLKMSELARQEQIKLSQASRMKGISKDRKEMKKYIKSWYEQLREQAKITLTKKLEQIDRTLYRNSAKKRAPRDPEFRRRALEHGGVMLLPGHLPLAGLLPSSDSVKITTANKPEKFQILVKQANALIKKYGLHTIATGGILPNSLGGGCVCIMYVKEGHISEKEGATYRPVFGVSGLDQNRVQSGQVSASEAFKAMATPDPVLGQGFQGLKKQLSEDMKSRANLGIKQPSYQAQLYFLQRHGGAGNLERWLPVKCAEPAIVMALAQLYHRTADLALSVPFEAELIMEQVMPKYTCARCATAEDKFAAHVDEGEGSRGRREVKLGGKHIPPEAGSLKESLSKLFKQIDDCHLLRGTAPAAYDEKKANLMETQHRMAMKAGFFHRGRKKNQPANHPSAAYGDPVVTASGLVGSSEKAQLVGRSEAASPTTAISHTNGATGTQRSKWVDLADKCRMVPEPTANVLTPQHVVLALNKSAEKHENCSNFWTAFDQHRSDHPEYRYALSPVQVINKLDGRDPTDLYIMREADWDRYEDFKRKHGEFQYL